MPGNNASSRIHATVRHGTYQRPSAPECAAKAAAIGSTSRKYLGVVIQCASPETRARPTIVTDTVAHRDLLPDITAYGAKIMAIGNPTTQQTTTIRNLTGIGAAS